ncbi:hypothetical protein VP1G_10853 [Cytospora mali]|uniref:Uncharacterized protein n=1 Tax=Cytospora mali TaxID=578113 RepID=A0A194UYV4_CYTMA|nr:hypothetical protein VP1G_10853 [Valsa mali var. pyri (nom. inval.)]
MTSHPALLMTSRAETSLDPLDGLPQQEVDELKRLGVDAAAPGTALGVVERQARGPLAAGGLAGELLEAVLALCAHVARHGQDEVGHEAHDGVLGGVDGTRDVQAPRVEDVQRALGEIDPHALAKADDGRVVDVHGVQNPISPVDLEVPEDDLGDLDGPVEGAGRGPFDLADGFRLDGVDVREVPLLRGPVHLYFLHACHVLVWVEVPDQICDTLVKEDGSIVYSERGTGSLEFFQDNIASMEAQVVLDQPLFAEFLDIFAKILGVFFRSYWHLVSRALYVTLSHEHVVEINLQLAIWPREELVRILHEMLVRRETVTHENRQRVFVPSPGSATLLSEIRDSIRETPGQNGIETTNVNSQLECRGCNDAHKLSFKHLDLDPPTILCCIPTPISHNTVNAVPTAQPLQLVLYSPDKLLTLFPHPAESNNPHAPKDKLTKKSRTLVHGIPPATRWVPRVLKWRIPAQELLPTRRRPVKINKVNVINAKDRAEVFLRIRHSRRATHEPDLPVPHSSAYPPEPPHYEGDVRAHQAVVVVQLVNDDVLQVLEERPPPLFLRQDGDVQHVRVGEDDAGPIADCVALLPGRVAVEGLHEGVL